MTELYIIHHLYTIHHYIKGPWKNTQLTCLTVHDSKINSADPLWLLNKCQEFAESCMRQYRDELEGYQIVTRNPFTKYGSFLGIEIRNVDEEEYKHAWIIVPWIKYPESLSN